MLRFSIFALIAMVIVSCSGKKDHTTLEYMPDMYRQWSVKAQEYDSTAPLKTGMRMPVAGTVPRGFEPYALALGDTLQAAALVNPYMPTPDVLATGQKYYMTYCVVCHGPRGDGLGYIVPKFTQPPSFHTDKVREWPDGRIYHVISRGQGLMPSYSAQILPEQRWAIIYYLRALQRAANPTAADLQLAPNSGFTFESDKPDTAKPKLWPDR